MSNEDDQAWLFGGTRSRSTPPAPPLEGARERIYADIDAERAAQDAKWGGKEHDEKHTVSQWAGFLHEHTNKAAFAASEGDIGEARRRLLEVAALAVAALEVVDRIAAYDSIHRRRRG
jgi:hypothetical protein